MDRENKRKIFEKGYYKTHACYDTGVTAQCGDLFLTLVTCAYQTENGRFVVVARKK